ncbi:MAG: hypothetical protein JO090_03100 [Rhizobacter sp.]|nr:hypothetical protein [Rhizobacter sp.]
MVKTELLLPELATIVGTRAMLGAGVALLLGAGLSAETRRGVGWALVGVPKTIPLAALALGGRTTRR